MASFASHNQSTTATAAATATSELTATLLAASRADPAAEQKLQAWSRSDAHWGAFCLALAQEIGDPEEQKPLAVRSLAGLFLKNMLYAKHLPTLLQNRYRWMHVLTHTQRTDIKRALLHSMQCTLSDSTGSSNHAGAAARAAALPAAEIASIELPYLQWPEFVPTLMERVVHHTHSNQKNKNHSSVIPLASLECLGYTAERLGEIEASNLIDLESVVSVDTSNNNNNNNSETTTTRKSAPPPPLDTSIVDQMLTTIVHGLSFHNPSSSTTNNPSSSSTQQQEEKIRLAAITALRNALGFVRKNMSVKAERDFMMQAICQAAAETPTPTTPSTSAASSIQNAKVRLVALECLDTIAELYYDTLHEYMPALFQLTTSIIRSYTHENTIQIQQHQGDDHVDEEQEEIQNDLKMAAMEFWSTIAYVEQGLLLDEEEQAEQQAAQPDPNNNSNNETKCPRYTASAVSELVPLLLRNLVTPENHSTDSSSSTTTLTGGGVLDEAAYDDDAAASSAAEAWNVQAAAVTCLENMALTVQDALLPHVMPFVEAHIAPPSSSTPSSSTSSHWKYRDAAIVAFASILEGPTDAHRLLHQYIGPALPILVHCFTDAQSLSVRDSAVHCMAKICRLSSIVALLPVDHIHTIAHALISKLVPPTLSPPQANSSSSLAPAAASLSMVIASHACSAIFNLAASVKANSPPPLQPEQLEAHQDMILRAPDPAMAAKAHTNTNALSGVMLPLLQALFAVGDRADAAMAASTSTTSGKYPPPHRQPHHQQNGNHHHYNNVLVSAMAAAGELVSSAAPDTRPILRDLFPVVVHTKLRTALQQPVLSSDDADHQEITAGLYCALITVLLQHMTRTDVAPHMDPCMELLGRCLSQRLCIEEAILSMGAVAGTVEGEFLKYLPPFMPFLLEGLKTVQAQSLCTVSVGVLVDVCNAVGPNIQPYCDEIMSALADALKDQSVSRDLKPVVISAFGDIAMAIGSAFGKYLQSSSMLLMQAANQTPSEWDDEEHIAFINSLRLSILEAYSGIILGLSDISTEARVSLLSPHITSVLLFLEYLSTPTSLRDNEVLAKAVTLLGDIATQLGNDMPLVRQFLTRPFVLQMINEASQDPDAVQVAEWSHSMIVTVLQQPQPQPQSQS